MVLIASSAKLPVVALIGIPLGLFGSVTTFALLVNARLGNQAAYVGCTVVLVLGAYVVWTAIDQVLLQHLSGRLHYDGLSVSRSLLFIPCVVVLLRLAFIQFRERRA